jgi:hypothetical protein
VYSSLAYSTPGSPSLYPPLYPFLNIFLSTSLYTFHYHSLYYYHYYPLFPSLFSYSISPSISHSVPRSVPPSYLYWEGLSLSLPLSLPLYLSHCYTVWNYIFAETHLNYLTRNVNVQIRFMYFYQQYVSFTTHFKNKEKHYIFPFCI